MAVEYGRRTWWWWKKGSGWRSWGSWGDMAAKHAIKYGHPSQLVIRDETVGGDGWVAGRLWYVNWNKKKVLQAVVPWPREKSRRRLLHLASAGPVIAVWPECRRQRWCPGRYGHRNGITARRCQTCSSSLTIDGRRFLLSMLTRRRFRSILKQAEWHHLEQTSQTIEKTPSTSNPDI